ncbi:helix-turn-helix transcriptional regulator [Halomonas chromatireducens]|uniref:Prophage CP4-57 regulatory protein (AlpA) n=1 Tax=Halomonas chromatireducens TaxID=507626 RepID=A0A0X8HB49_9GAMM|nr:helix-turn-helix domain-containing protein [Halomonas chromatireducens]AMC99349.1 Prophage CP4-57 regulatory protein (AlpA) [Halomonas chromatireducens]
MADPTRAATTGGNDTTAPEKQSASNAWHAWLSVKQLASRYGAHEATIWRWSREGRFVQPVKLAGNLTRWSLSDVESWEQAQREASA